MAETTLQKAYAEKALAQRNTLTPMIRETLGGLMPQIPALLPADITTEQFRAALYLELSGEPQLAECTRDSLRDAVLKAALYGLLPGRDCHIVPFRNTKNQTREATNIPNYMGIILALERTGKVRRAFAHAVHEGDEWGFDYFADRPIHKPAASLGHPQGKILFYYGAVLLHDGTCHFEVMELADIDAVRLRAPAHESGPWVSDRVMMSRKTALKRMSKYVKLTDKVRALLDDDDARERKDIPEARHRDNITALYGDGAGADPTAYPPRPEAPVDLRPATHVPQTFPPLEALPSAATAPAAGEQGLPYVAQIEAAIVAHEGHLEPWYVWAERRYKKGRETFTVADWEDFLVAVRAGVQATRQPLPRATPPTPTPAVSAHTEPTAPFVDPETGEVVTPDASAGPSWGPENPNLFLEEEEHEKE